MTETVFECAPGVEWVVETYGILIFHPERGAFCSLPYPAAALWDFVSRGYRPSRLPGLLKYVGFDDEAAAEKFVAECLAEWAEGGLLRPAGGGGEVV